MSAADTAAPVATPPHVTAAQAAGLLLFTVLDDSNAGWSTATAPVVGVFKRRDIDGQAQPAQMSGWSICCR